MLTRLLADLKTFFFSYILEKFGKERKKERERIVKDKRGNDGILKNWEMELLKNGKENVYIRKN